MLTALVGISKEWRQLGLRLGINEDIIDEIEANHLKDGVKRCLEEVVKSWLEGKGNGSRLWSFLCGALRDKLVNRPVIADDIELEYVLQID